MQDKFSTRTREGDKKFLEIPNLKQNPINLPIIMAALNGEMDELTKLLKNGWPNSALQQFIFLYLFQMELHLKQRIHNRYEVIKLLVQKEANINDILFSPLDFETVKAIAEGGGNLKYSKFNYTPLHAIVTNPVNLNPKEHIECLLKNGVDPNKSTEFGTALHVSIANESFDVNEKHHIPKYLIHCLDQYHYDWNIPDSEGKTPLILAAKVRSPALVKQLIEKKTKDKANIHLNAQDHKGRTALHFACALGDSESTQVLLSAGASLEMPDRQGKLAFDYTKLDEASVRNILEEIHIDPDRDENAINNHVLRADTYQPVTILEEGVSLTFFSRKKDWDKFGEALITKVQNKPYQQEKWREHDIKHFKVQGNLSGKPLISACREGQQNVRSCFLADIAKKPLTYAQLLEKTKEALKNDPTIQPFLGFIEANNLPRALREVCATGKNVLAAMLIAYVVNANLPIKDYINQASTNGKTALHWAACSAHETGDTSLVELLLTYGPDATIRDKAKHLYSDYLTSESFNTTASSRTSILSTATHSSNNALNEEEDDFGLGCSIL